MRTLSLLCALLVGEAVPAQQHFPRTSLRPWAIERRPQPDDHRHPPPYLLRSAGPNGIAARYWYWNRGSLLPRPEPRPMAAPATLRMTATSAARSERAWLFEAVRSPDASQRARAIYAIGCAGPSANGYPSLLAALADDEQAVRLAALLGLGEHAGTAARFRLVRAMDERWRSREYRRTAALAYGIACAVDGGEGGRALRRFARAATDLSGREAACAADRLSGGGALAAEAAGWLVACDRLASATLPAIAIDHALVGLPRDRVVPRLRYVLGASKLELLLAARASALAHGEVPASMLKDWIDGPKLEVRALTIFAAVDHRGFPAVARRGFKSATLRGVCALALAVHARRNHHPGALDELVAAARNQRSFAERPLWLLAIALTGDRTAPARAQALLQEPRSAEGLRLAAADVLALQPDGDRAALRCAVHLDPSPAVRLRAADGVARHGEPEDARTLVYAVEHAATAEERARLLLSLGRTRHPGAREALRRWCSDPAAPPCVRRGAWLGLAHSLRHAPEAPLARLPRGIAFAYLPGWLLELADSQR